MFEKLEFKQHANCTNGTMAHLIFDNGFGASVITGDMFFTSPGTPYELTVIRGTLDDWSLCYTTPVTDDVIGYLNQKDVEKLLVQISELPATT